MQRHGRALQRAIECAGSVERRDAVITAEFPRQPSDCSLVATGQHGTESAANRFARDQFARVPRGAVDDQPRRAHEAGRTLEFDAIVLGRDRVPAAGRGLSRPARRYATGWLRPPLATSIWMSPPVRRRNVAAKLAKSTDCRCATDSESSKGLPTRSHLVAARSTSAGANPSLALPLEAEVADVGLDADAALELLRFERRSQRAQPLEATARQRGLAVRHVDSVAIGPAVDTPMPPFAGRGRQRGIARDRGAGRGVRDQSPPLSPARPRP